MKPVIRHRKAIQEKDRVIEPGRRMGQYIIGCNRELRSCMEAVMALWSLYGGPAAESARVQGLALPGGPGTSLSFSLNGRTAHSTFRYTQRQSSTPLLDVNTNASQRPDAPGPSSEDLCMPYLSWTQTIVTPQQCKIYMMHSINTRGQLLSSLSTTCVPLLRANLFGQIWALNSRHM